jgi:hypothetical protein
VPTPQERVGQIRAFHAELDELARAGVDTLSPDDLARVRAYHDALVDRLAAAHDIDRTEGARRLSRGMQLASFFGAVTLTAGLYLMVQRFWARLDLPLQATLLAAFSLTALVSVELSARRERTLYIASLFASVAYGTFWLAAVVLTSTLDIPPTPHLLWAGVVFGLALALPYRFRLILAIALVAAIVAIPATVFQSAGVPWTELFARPEMSMVVAFGIGAIVAKQLDAIDRGFAAAARLVGFGIGLGCILYMTFQGRATMLPFSGRVAEVVYQAVMLVVTLLILVLAVRRRWTETVHVASVALALFLLSRFVDWFWDAVPTFVFFFALAGVAFAWLLAMRRLRARLGPS